MDRIHGGPVGSMEGHEPSPAWPSPPLGVRRTRGSRTNCTCIHAYDLLEFADPSAPPFHVVQLPVNYLCIFVWVSRLVLLVDCDIMRGKLLSTALVEVLAGSDCWIQDTAPGGCK